MKTVFWVIAILVAAVALVLLIAAGRPPSVSEATADFCADLSDYGRAVLNLRTIDESSTVAELQEAGAAVQDSLEGLQESGSVLSEARTAELEATQDALQTTIHSIPDEATLVQAQAHLRLATLNAVAGVVDVMTTTCRINIPQGATTLPQR